MLLAACAGLSAAQAAGPALSWATGRTSYDAVERLPEDGSIANRDSGTVRTQRVRLDVPLAAAWWLAWRRSAGDVGYAGRTQIGLPVATTTALRLDDVETGVGHRLAAAGTAAIDITAALGWRRHVREIRPAPFASALTETTRQAVVQLGLQGRWQPWPAFALHAQLEGDRPWHSRLDADFHGALANATVEPSARWSRRAELRADWQPTPWLVLGLARQSESMHLGPSAAVTQGNGFSVSFPGAHLRLNTTLLSVRLAWE